MRSLTRGARVPTRRIDRLGGLVDRAVALVMTWQRRARERDQLARLTEREMRDMGITRCDAAALARKPFWRR